MSEDITQEQQIANRTKWIEALRSGDYEQGKTYLRKNDNYCCLGVLCEVLGLPEKEVDHEGVHVFLTASTDLRAVPDHGVMYAVGMTMGEASMLMIENDNGTPFDEIADMIERRRYD